GGSVFMERFQHTANLLTVIQTCRPQALSLIEFLTNLSKGWLTLLCIHLNSSSLDLNPYF
ncbi:hypothetical protein, partial [Trichormus azollae]|uniref:hypothetical protein n=1 Tax=Trichormus azollae TaxID=1164 RepID=UPI00325CE135